MLTEHLQTTMTTMAPNVSNGTEDGGLPLALGERKWFIIFKYSMYCIIFLISLIGNTMVCFVICRRMKVKTVTNYFIMNLAISDLLYTLCVPFDVYATVSNAWPYGAIMCRVLWPAQTMTITVSGFTLTALSVTRFWAVVKPLRRQLSVKQASTVITLLWVLATSTVIPYIIYLKLSSHGACEEKWPLRKLRQGYTASLFVIQYMLPITIIVGCYSKIAFELTKGQPKTTNRTLAKARGKEARKVIKMLIIVTLVFALLTLPSSIMWMWLDFGDAVNKLSYFWDVMEVLNVLDFLNCASNPIIYAFCNESFSREFRRQLGCVLTVQASTTSNNSNESGKGTTVIALSSPGNGHATPLRASLSKDGNSEQNADRATLL